MHGKLIPKNRESERETLSIFKKEKDTGLPLSDSSVPWSIRETSQRDTR